MDEKIIMERNELLQALTAEKLEPVDEENEVTIQMLSKNTGLSENAWRDRMKKLEKAGKVVSRRALGKNGNAIVAYRKAGP